MSSTDAVPDQPEHDQPSTPTATARPTPGRRWWWLSLIVLVIGYAADQLTKYWVESTMYQGQIIDVAPPLLRWHYILNPGAAFSIGEEHTWIFTLIQAAVAVVVAVLILRVRSKVWAVALGGLLGGVLGNLTDRLFRPPGFAIGHVVDFIALPNFAIFNIADSLIVCSIIGIVLLMFSGRRLDGTHDTDHHHDDAASDQPAPSDVRDA